MSASEPSPWILSLGLVLVALASWAATGALRRLLIVWRIYDRPNQRSSHVRPKPRGGGLAVISVILVAWIALASMTSSMTAAFWQVVGGAVLLGAISWADDLKSRPASLRFGVQVAAVTLGLWGLAPAALVFQGLLPLPVDRLVTALLWLWFINLFNFMDGIDGITAVETVTIGGGLAAVSALTAQDVADSLAAAVPAAAALGFVYWNWAPSRIFLGDVGSVPLGFLLGWLLIDTAVDGLWAVALILPLYYLADASLTLARRVVTHSKPWQPHREHFYQRAVQRGFSHAAVAGRVLVCNIALVGSALLAAAAESGDFHGIAPGMAVGMALTPALLAVVVLLFILARQRPPMPTSGSARPPRRN